MAKHEVQGHSGVNSATIWRVREERRKKRSRDHELIKQQQREIADLQHQPRWWWEWYYADDCSMAWSLPHEAQSSQARRQRQLEQQPHGTSYSLKQQQQQQSRQQQLPQAAPIPYSKWDHLDCTSEENAGADEKKKEEAINDEYSICWETDHCEDTEDGYQGLERENGEGHTEGEGDHCEITAGASCSDGEEDEEEWPSWCQFSGDVEANQTICMAELEVAHEAIQTCFEATLSAVVHGGAKKFLRSQWAKSSEQHQQHLDVLQVMAAKKFEAKSCSSVVRLIATWRDGLITRMKGLARAPG